MEHWMCITCGTQYPASPEPPQGCPICLDKRQYVRHEGQAWTTIATMQRDGFHNTLRQLEPGLTGFGTEPSFAIAQRAMLIQTEQGNVLWECISLLDDETVAAVQQLGGIQAIAISHPHFYTSMMVLSGLKPYLGIESSFCYSSPSMKREREAEIYELSLLCGIHIQKTSKENRAWLCNLLLLSMQTDL
jgi:hypothetical protein